MDEFSNEAERIRVLATEWEVLLARMLLRLADKIASEDEDQEFTELYNSIKPLAEHTMRGGRRDRQVLKGVQSGKRKKG